VKIFGYQLHLPPRRLGDIAGILVVAWLLAVVLSVFLIFPLQTRKVQTQVNFGFGPEWDCVYPGKGQEMCIKSLSKPAAPSNQSSPWDELNRQWQPTQRAPSAQKRL